MRSSLRTGLHPLRTPLLSFTPSGSSANIQHSPLCLDPKQCLACLAPLIDFHPGLLQVGSGVSLSGPQDPLRGVVAACGECNAGRLGPEKSFDSLLPMSLECRSGMAHVANWLSCRDLGWGPSLLRPNGPGHHNHKGHLTIRRNPPLSEIPSAQNAHTEHAHFFVARRSQAPSPSSRPSPDAMMSPTSLPSRSSPPSSLLQTTAVASIYSPSSCSTMCWHIPMTSGSSLCHRSRKHLLSGPQTLQPSKRSTRAKV